MALSRPSAGWHNQAGNGTDEELPDRARVSQGMKKRDYRLDTLVAHLGRDPAAHSGAVNPPVFHASTVLYEGVEAYEKRHPAKGVTTYGRFGTPTTFALQSAIAELQGGADCVCVSSGLAAITCAMLSLVEAGDHILVPDSTYYPTRAFCDGLLRRLGVATTYYDPRAGADIAASFRPQTRLVYIESPGSLTFEVQDVPAIAAVAKAAGAAVIMDTTWATPVHVRPFDLGVDIAVEAGTKYVVGHSDAMMGLITSTPDYEAVVGHTVRELGVTAGPDDVYLALRGLRTLTLRLERHQETALALAAWLSQRPEVAQVLYPALPEHPDHRLWKRDFSGASGLFGVVLGRPYGKAAVAAMLDGMALFGIGSSWGGFESLMIPACPQEVRSATRWDAPGPLLRIHAGLEDVEDLIADLEAGFARLHAAHEEAPQEPAQGPAQGQHRG